MPDIHELEAFGSDHSYTIEEVCQCVNLDTEFVIQCVDYGITEVSGGRAAEEWLFPPRSLITLKKAWRLQRDLELNFAGLAVVLDLLEDVENLRARVRLLNDRLGAWEDLE